MKQDQKVDKELERINNWYDIETRIASHFNNSFSSLIQSHHVLDAIFLLLADKRKLEWVGSLWDIDYTFDEALKLLEGFDFNVLLNPIETPKEFLPERLIMQFKVRIKNKGIIWIIHRYDSDPFPSNPHAHQIGNNIKLDLSNGKCYQYRKLIHVIRKKELLQIREAAMKVYKGRLPELAV